MKPLLWHPNSLENFGATANYALIGAIADIENQCSECGIETTALYVHQTAKGIEVCFETDRLPFTLISALEVFGDIVTGHDVFENSISIFLAPNETYTLKAA